MNLDKSFVSTKLLYKLSHLFSMVIGLFIQTGTILRVNEGTTDTQVTGQVF